MADSHSLTAQGRMPAKELFEAAVFAIICYRLPHYYYYYYYYDYDYDYDEDDYYFFGSCCCYSFSCCSRCCCCYDYRYNCYDFCDYYY